jgi:PadR family transcriptional regulator PadR
MVVAVDRESSLLRGTLDLCVMALLSREPLHAYGVVQRLGEYGFDQSTHGTVYPLVTRLRRAGLVSQHSTSGQGGPTRHVLSLTAEGEQALAEWAAQWHSHRDRVDGLLSMEGVRHDG